MPPICSAKLQWCEPLALLDQQVIKIRGSHNYGKILFQKKKKETQETGKIRNLRYSGRISGCTRPLLRCGLNLSVCTYNNCRWLSRVKVNISRKLKSCDILGMCETHRVRLKHCSAQDRVRGVWAGVGLPSAESGHCLNHLLSLSMCAFRLDFNETLSILQIYAPTTACEDDVV